MTPIKHASVAWRRVVARSHSARRLPPPEHVCLSQSKRWRGGTRPTAACACTVVCVCVCVRRRSWAGLWAVMERRTWHSLAVCVGFVGRDAIFPARLAQISLVVDCWPFTRGLSSGVWAVEIQNRPHIPPCQTSLDARPCTRRRAWKTAERRRTPSRRSEPDQRFAWAQKSAPPPSRLPRRRRPQRRRRRPSRLVASEQRHPRPRSRPTRSSSPTFPSR